MGMDMNVDVDVDVGVDMDMMGSWGQTYVEIRWQLRAACCQGGCPGNQGQQCSCDGLRDEVRCMCDPCMHAMLTCATEVDAAESSMPHATAVEFIIMAITQNVKKFSACRDAEKQDGEQQDGEKGGGAKEDGEKGDGEKGDSEKGRW